MVKIKFCDPCQARLFSCHVLSCPRARVQPQVRSCESMVSQMMFLDRICRRVFFINRSGRSGHWGEGLKANRELGQVWKKIFAAARTKITVDFRVRALSTPWSTMAPRSTMILWYALILWYACGSGVFFLNLESQIPAHIPIQHHTPSCTPKSRTENFGNLNRSKLPEFHGMR